jgi:hypothetical protein
MIGTVVVHLGSILFNSYLFPLNEHFPCSLKKGPTRARRVPFVFRYVAYWRVKVKKEKIDPAALLERKADAYWREAPIGIGLTIHM